MSVLELDYSDMSDIVDAANGLASKAEEYAEKLTQRFSKKIDDVTGGMNGHLSSANYYVNAKIKDLNAKQSKYKSFASKVEKLATVAKDMDKKVAKTITDNKERFLEVNKHLKVSDIKAWFIEKWVSFKNLNPIFEKIGNIIDEIDTGIDEIKSSLKEWYRYEGGKELIEIGYSVLLAVVAVALVVVSFPLSGFVAIAGFVSAIIGVLNSFAKIYTSCKSYQEKRNGNPAMAKYVGDQETVSDVLRKNNFHDKHLNRFWNDVAMGLDATETVLSAIDFAHNGYEFYEKCARKGMLSKMKTFKPSGKTGYTLSSIKDGFKSYKKQLSPKLVKDVIKKNFKESFNEMYKGSKKERVEGIKETLEFGNNISSQIFDGYDKDKTKDSLKKTARKGSKTLKNIGEGVDIYNDTHEKIDKWKSVNN